MKLSPNDKKRLLTFLGEVKRNKNAELECIVRPGKLDKYAFTDLLKYLRSVHGTPQATEESLNVIFEHKNESYRYEIEGLKNIEAFCKSDKPPSGTKLVRKTWVEGMYPIDLAEYDTKVNLKAEVEVEEPTPALIASFETSPKLFRLKKRFSFKLDVFMVDCTVVKSARGSSVMDSKVTSAKQKYEVEIEYTKEAVPQDAWLRSFLNAVAEVMCALDNDDYVVPASEKRAAIEAYARLTNNDVKTPKFVGPMPVTLEKKNLFKPQLGLDSVLEGYTVTDKADGERHLFFVDAAGKAYLINNRMNVRYTGCTASKYANSLLDGEFVTKTRFGDPCKLFAVFDVYYIRGKSVASQPLMKRLEHATAMAASGLFKHGQFEVKVKDFYDGDVKAGAKEILRRYETGETQYTIDGLVFTPADLPVGGLRDDDNPKWGGTWIKVFKWKPPHDNTIDFLVKIEKNSQGQDIITKTQTASGLSKMVSLYVGFKTRYTAKITPKAYLTKQVTSEKLNAYYPKLFVPEGAIFQNVSQFALELDNERQLRCANGDPITHNSVIEFAFSEGRWHPNRARPDKTSGNDYFTAINIWRSIQNPVETSMVTGEEEVVQTEADLLDDDQYYNRMYGRERSATKPMLDFHNHYVKNQTLVRAFAGKVKRVFDIACGKGNDFYKYLSSGIHTIVGVDKSEDNIVNAGGAGDEGAYARLLKEAEKSNGLIKPETKIVYLPMDASKVIDADYIKSLEPDSKEVAEVVWGLQEPSLPVLKPYYNMFGKGFELVACQFAVHYFLESPTTLQALIKNIDAAIAPGGYFVGTCLDGKAVDAAFQQADVGDSIEGTLGGRTVWSVRKMYDAFSTDPTQNYNKRIEVYMETINRQISEFLVDFELLARELAKHNILPLNENEYKELGLPGSTGLFGDLYAAMVNYAQSGASDRFLASALSMTDTEKQYSFMNRWFVFRKANPPKVDVLVEPAKPTKPRLVIRRKAPKET